jgi:hypothetical protein
MKPFSMRLTDEKFYFIFRLQIENMSILAEEIICVLTGTAYATRNHRKEEQLYGEQHQIHTQPTKQIILYM